MTEANETTVQQDDDTTDDGQVNPAVGEAKKYRKRAQAAERTIGELQQQLSEKATRLTELEQTVADMERAGQVDQLLIEADAIDLESTRLLTSLAMEQMDEPDANQAVAELKRRKPYLFRAASRYSGAMGARPESATPVREAASRAAEQACTTGNRTDLLRYLRLRRAAK